MAVDSKHPKYILWLPDWGAMRDTFRGERCVKGEGTTYLPATKGMRLDGMIVGQEGWESYQSYRARAVFHNFVSEAVETLLGTMWNKPPTIELPSAMEPMREKATVKGESLEMVLRRINEEQLISGRVGAMLDLPADPTLDPNVMPYIALYDAEKIINWDDGAREELVLQVLNFVALDETEDERNGDFEWEEVTKTRILVLGEADPNEPKGIYKQGLFRDESEGFNESALIAPSFKGNTLEEIPFVFINTKDIVADPDDPPLLDLAMLCLAIYRGEADYRQSLFLQGQDTLVIIGGSGDDSYRIGAGASIEVQIGGDAKFIGVSSDGLSEQREALENDKTIAAKKAGSMAQKGAQVESGDAMKIRFGATTASMTQVAITGAFGLQSLLRIQARWMGANEEEVLVLPNLDFSDDVMESKTLVEYMSAKTMGAPLSLETIHARMKEKGITDKEFEEELALIEAEEPLTAPLIVDEDGNEMPTDSKGRPMLGTDDEEDEEEVTDGAIRQ